MRTTLVLILALAAVSAFGAGKFGDPVDLFKFGKPGSTDDKVIEIRTASPATTLQITVDDATRDFDFNKTVNVDGEITTTGNASISGELLSNHLKTASQTLTLGSGVDQDFTIEVDRAGFTPYQRYDEALKAWVFSNDGTIQKKVGSGGGGGIGVNFFTDNPDAEAGTNNWTASGVSFGTTSTASETYNGDNSFTADFSANGQTLTTDAQTVKAGFLGNACENAIHYIGGTDDLLELQFLTGGVVTASVSMPARTTWGRLPVYDLCPPEPYVGETIALRIAQVAAGDPDLIRFDDAHVGSSTGLGTSVPSDSLAVKISNGGSASIVSVNVENWVSVVRNSTGNLTLTVESPAGVSNALACGCTIDDPIGSGADSKCITDVVSSSTINVRTSAASTNAVQDVDFDLVCEKQGTDASVARQVFTSIPRIADNINDFHGQLDGATGAISGSNVSFIVGDACTRTGAGDYSCSFKAGIFTVAPSVDAKINSNPGINRAAISAVTASGFDLDTKNSGGTPTDFSSVALFVNKSSPDFETPIVQPTLVNQVQTPIKAGTVVCSGTIQNNAGTIVIEDEDGCLDSVTRNGVGDVDLDFLPSFAGGPKIAKCMTSPAEATFQTLDCYQDNTASDVDTANIKCKNTSDTSLDRDFHFSCRLAR